MRRFETLAELAACVGQELAVSDWLGISQAQIDRFAKATDDHPWIHVGTECARSGPFGTTIAHGFLTLLLLPRGFGAACHVAQVRMGVNDRLNKARFMAPVQVSSRLRAPAAAGCRAAGGRRLQTTWGVTLARKGQARPVCVAESLVRHCH